ncbi:hypothetical protein QA597_03440 [Marinilabiliaceae bacterium ANBcel2]|nr:hypothetical protein [Marinilabiliaceae bacterium ANBcel2]
MGRRKLEIKMPNEPIDAVITWVDGKKSDHKKRVSKCLNQLKVETKAADPTRFIETGEFEYSIASLLRFAPWLNKIYIVTDNQKPAFWSKLKESKFKDKVKIVSHDVIFKGHTQELPTFNCRSIFTMLWRIPGLSERYIYLDDDFILLKPLSPENFFKNEKIVVRGKWKTQQTKKTLTRFFYEYSLKNKEYKRAGNRRGQAYAADKAGFEKKYFRAPHNPHPQLVSLQSNFYTKNPEILSQNIKYKFRSHKQFVPTALTTHLALKQNKAVTIEKNSSMRLKMDQTNWLKLKIQLWGTDYLYKKYDFGCIQSLDLASKKTRKILFKWLNKRVGTLDNILNIN